MHVIIVGCGRVGSTLARRLHSAHHEVVVIDRKPDALRRLGDDFTGRTIAGVGFDRDLLREAGLTSESAVIAVTSGDNSNILIARVARELFGSQRVVARIYDPKRASVYERLGIATVATVTWTSTRILRLVEPQHGLVDWTDPTSTHVVAEREVGATLAATAVGSLESSSLRIALLTRNGTASIPSPDLLLQEGDRIHLIASIGALESFDNATPQAEVHP